MRAIDADAFKEYIRNALEETKHIYKDNGAWAKEITENFCKDIDEQPTVLAEPKRGRWILDRSGAYCCSECMEPCASYVMMKPRDKFCKMCGAKMEVNNE